MLLLKALVIWVVIALAEIAHGIARTLLLAPRIGKLRSDQIGVFSGSLIILAISWFLVPWLGTNQSSDLALVGAVWVVLMLTFEFTFGRRYLRLPWDRIIANYDLRRGGLMGFGMLFLFFAPLLTARLLGLL